MVYWQLTVFLLLSLAIVCITSSSGDDDKDPKMCFVMTDPSNSNGRCWAYCVYQRKKAGGSCKNRRCVCSEAPAKGENGNQNQNGNQNSQSRQLIIPTVDTAALCRLYCENLDKYETEFLKDICDCSKP